MIVRININYLQLCSFYASKDFTNKVFEDEDYWKNLWENINKSFMHLLPELAKNCRLESIGIGCHECKRDSQYNLLHIIKSCHNDLWTWLVQKTENTENVIYFQVHIGHKKSKEVIYSLLFKESDNQKVFYPLILDLNHCIYKVSEDKSYRYKYNRKWTEWDFNSKSKEIHGIILRNLNNYNIF